MSLIKDNHIQLKDKDYKPSGGRFSQEQIAKMKQEAERAITLQEELGLGKPNKNFLVSHLAQAEKVKALDKVLTSKKYRVVDISDRKNLPLFTRKDGEKMWEESGNKFDSPPLLAITKLDKDVSEIRCSGKANSGDRREYYASIPVIPPEGCEKAKELVEDIGKENVEFYLAFMPSWQEEFQKDPILLAKIADEFLAVHELGGDLDLLQEFILKQ